MCQAEIEAELSPLKDLELLVHPWILRPTVRTVNDVLSRSTPF